MVVQLTKETKKRENSVLKNLLKILKLVKEIRHIAVKGAATR